MSKLIFKFFCIVALSSIMACSSQKKAKSWNSSMQGLSKTLSETMPLLISQKYLTDPRAQSDLKAATVKLQGLSHDVSTQTLIPSADPSIKVVARQFGSELKQAQNLMEMGQWAAANKKLQKVTNYCIACHTLSSGSTSAYSADLAQPPKSFQHFDQARYFASIRQFEQAIIQFEYALNDQGWAKTNRENWNRSLLSLMAIVTRVKNNPNLARELISRFYDTGAYPQDLKKASDQWRSDVKAWDAEKKRQPSLARSRNLIQTAAKSEKAIPHSGLILNLRASSTLNELLRSGQLDKKQQQEVLYLSGQVAENLADLNFGSFAEDYYRLCSQMKGRATLQKKCSVALGRITSDQ